MARPEETAATTAEEAGAGGRRCRWCARPIDVQAGPGRPKEFCRRSCRQRDYEARQRAAEVGLSEDELILTRRAIEELRDKLYVLEAATQDVARDLSGSPTKDDYREAVEWLLEAARPLAGEWDADG